MVPNFTEQIEKDKANEWNVHDWYKTHTLSELQDVCKRDRLPYSVCVLNFTGDLNISSTMRTASIMGARKFIIFGRRKFDRRGTVGAQNYIDLIRVSGLKEDGTLDTSKFWATMSEHDLWPIFVETNGEPLGVFNWTRHIEGRTRGEPCLVFGNETFGIPEILCGPGPTVRIPQRGVLRSLNVSSAASIVMWDLVSRHFMTPYEEDESDNQ